MDHLAASLLFATFLLGPLEALRLVVVGFLALLAFLLVKQSDLLYQPSAGGMSRRVKDNPPGMRRPEEVGLTHYECVEDLVADDGTRLAAWMLFSAVPLSANGCATFIYLHGNAGNIGHRLDLYKKLMDRLDVNILALEWRGFGESQGMPTEEGLVKDAMAALAWLRKPPRRVDPSKIFLFGTSLGGAVSIALASLNPDVALRGLICENSFTNVADMGCAAFPIRMSFLVVYSCLEMESEP